MWIVLRIDKVWKARPFNNGDAIVPLWAGIFPTLTIAQAYAGHLNQRGDMTDETRATTRYVVDYDYDCHFKERNGLPRPLVAEEYVGHEYWRDDGQRISYEDYLSYYGNPVRHVYLFVRRETRCECCGHWIYGDAIYGIDVMDDEPEARAIGTFSLPQLPGYLRDIAVNLDADAGASHD